MCSYRGVLVATLIDGTGLHPKTEPRPVVKTSTLQPVAADDRSSAYGILLSVEQERGDSLAARRTAQAWASFLEAQAARAATPEERTVFDSHRLTAYLELGEPERALPMLLASERDFPSDYNPPARLAIAYRELAKEVSGGAPQRAR